MLTQETSLSNPQLSRRLDDITRRCRAHLVSQKTRLGSDMDIPATCIAICAFMRSEGLTSVHGEVGHPAVCTTLTIFLSRIPLPRPAE